jgi:hypothetical protein
MCGQRGSRIPKPNSNSRVNDPERRKERDSKTKEMKIMTPLLFASSIIRRCGYQSMELPDRNLGPRLGVKQVVRVVSLPL